MTNLQNIKELIKKLPLIDFEKVNYNNLLREEFDSFSNLDDLLDVIKKDLKYLEETAVEAVALVEKNKFCSKLEDFAWEVEFEQFENGSKYLSIFLALNSKDDSKGKILLPIHILRDLKGNYIYFEPTHKDDNLDSIKILTKGSIIDSVKNWLTNSRAI